MGAAVLRDRTNATLGAPLTPFAHATVTRSKQAHIELITAANYWKTAHQRAATRARWIEGRHHHERERAKLREACLRDELELARAQLRDLRQRVFGTRTEQSRLIKPALRPTEGPARPRGQQRGRPGHARTRLEQLPPRTEIVKLDSVCPQCGLGLSAFPGSEDCEVVELEVKAYRRVIRRQRNRPTCRCGCLDGIVTAPASARLIPRASWTHRSG